MTGNKSHQNLCYILLTSLALIMQLISTKAVNYYFMDLNNNFSGCNQKVIDDDRYDSNLLDRFQIVMTVVVVAAVVVVIVIIKFHVTNQSKHPPGAT